VSVVQVRDIQKSSAFNEHRLASKLHATSLKKLLINYLWNMPTLKVLIVGPSLVRTRGGMATVINNILQHKGGETEIKIKHIVSHVEGGTIEKLLVACKALLSVLAQRRFDILHIHVASDVSIFRKSLFVYLGVLLNKLIILHIHGGDFDVYYNSSSPPIKFFIRKTLLKCHKILVLSDYWKSFFETCVSGSNVEVLHNGVQLDGLKTCQTAPYNQTRFLFLGRLSKAKGIYDLLQAIDILVNQQNQRKLIFFLAGEGDLEQVKNIIKQKGLEENVHLLGWINDIEKKEWLRKVDTLVLPSYIEGLPMSIIEAMAAGKVIISSRIGGIPDLVKEENGWLITPGDVRSLCEHILYVSTHPEQITAMSDRNASKVDDQYNLDKINARLFDIYAELHSMKYPFERVTVPAYEYDSQTIG